MYSVFFITSNLERIFEYSSQVWCMKTLMKTGRYMQNFYPFSKFCGFMSERWVLLLDFAPPFGKLPFFLENGYEYGRTLWSGVGVGVGWVGGWGWAGVLCRDLEVWLSGYLLLLSHDAVIKWKDFPRYWPFVRGIHRSPVNSPHKGQWRGALMFLWFAPE